MSVTEEILLEPAEPTSWKTRLAWAVSILFNPFWTVAYAVGQPGGGLWMTLMLSVFYLLPCMALAKGMERLGVLSHWLMPTRQDRVIGMLVCGVWCVGMPSIMLLLLGIDEVTKLIAIDIPISESRSFTIDKYGFWWVGGYILGLSSLIGALASRFSKASLHMTGAIAAVIIGAANLYMHNAFSGFVDRDSNPFLGLAYFIGVSALLIGSVWWARRYLDAHTRREMWQGLGWGVLLGVLCIGVFIVIIAATFNLGGSWG